MWGDLGDTTAKSEGEVSAAAPVVILPALATSPRQLDFHLWNVVQEPGVGLPVCSAAATCENL